MTPFVNLQRPARVRFANVSSRGRQRTTIRQLAEQTGLSTAAVSYALRGMHVSAETEERVRAAAAELGYEADPIARALRGGATAVVGLLVGSLADFWNQELVRAVQLELYAADRSTLVADADGEPAGELDFDNERGVHETLQHLSELGHDRVTVLSWAVETSPEREAERAVAASADALGIECRLVPCAHSLNGSPPPPPPPPPP